MYADVEAVLQLFQNFLVPKAETYSMDTACKGSFKAPKKWWRYLMLTLLFMFSHFTCSPRQWSFTTLAFAHWNGADRVPVSNLQYPRSVLAPYIVPICSTDCVCDANGFDACQTRKLCGRERPMLPPLPCLLEQQERCESCGLRF